MRLIHLPTFWTILLDFAAWFVIHLAIVFFAVRVPVRRFHPEGILYRPRDWEKDGRFYQKYFRIKNWKQYAPDGAGFIKDRGFPKKRLRHTGTRYLHAFLLETCRAELTHWLLIGVAPLFFLWNRFWVGMFMIFYALVQNIPLIMIQRYNRARFRRIVVQRDLKN